MWGSKGGAGTSVTAAAAALHETKPVLLVDLDGDAASILGADRSRIPIGANDWLAHNDIEPERLTELIDDTTSVLSSGTRGDIRYANPDRVEQLANWIADQPASSSSTPAPDRHHKHSSTSQTATSWSPAPTISLSRTRKSSRPTPTKSFS
jgi:hypothetical protein